MQTPRQFAQSLAWMTFNRKPDLNQWENHIRARDAAVRAPLVEALVGARETISRLTMGTHPAIKAIDAALEAAKGE